MHMETSSDTNARVKLEVSKERLAAAFGHLERAIEQRIVNAAAPPSAAPNNELIKQNAELSQHLETLHSNYNHLKTVSTTVFNQLTTSIATLETLLKNKNTH
jgi:hypothetical protein